MLKAQEGSVQTKRLREATCHARDKYGKQGSNLARKYTSLKTFFQAKKKISPAIKLMQNAFIHKGVSSLQKLLEKNLIQMLEKMFII